MASDAPTIRWGIIGAGMISGWFVTDILLPTWPNKRASHAIAAVGSSSVSRGEEFVKKNITNGGDVPSSIKVYGSYEEVYADPDVDVIYIGTPHSFHKKNCLDAIAAGKHVLCEKPFTMNVREAEVVVKAAREKGVFLMEAMWTRFYPLVKDIQRMLHDEKAIGTIHRTFAEFGLFIDIPNLPATSRYKDLSLGAGSLLDIGIYSLTWGLLSLDAGVGDKAQNPIVASSQTLVDGVDTASAIILQYPETRRQGIITSTTDVPNVESEKMFCRIEGSKGCVKLYGATASPERFEVIMRDGETKSYEYEKPGRGFYWEADEVAVCIREGRKESETMPLSETLRVMRILDGVRERSGNKFPQDDE